MAVGRYQNGPIYKTIQSAILEQIKAGKLRPGDAVASERELARVHGVSLMTARHALADLEREGVVERRRGAGTFVAPPKIHFNRLMSYTEQMTARSLNVTSKVIIFKVIDNEPDIAARLCLPITSRLIKLERVRQAGNEPFALETCYLSADEFSGLRREWLERGSLFSTLERDYGVEIAHADEEVDATAADAVTARLLAMPQTGPLLRIRQVIYTSKGKPAIYVLGLYRADRHRLHIRRFRALATETRRGSE